MTVPPRLANAICAGISPFCIIKYSLNKVEVDNRFDIALFKECIKKSQWLIATAENHFSTKTEGRTCRFGGTTKIAIINRHAFNTGSYFLGATFFCFLLKRYMSFLKYCVEIGAVTTD